MRPNTGCGKRPIHLTFPCPLVQPPKPTSALNDVAHPRLPRAVRGLIARQAWDGKTTETCETRQSVLLTQCTFVSFSIDLSLCLENTVVTGSVRLIPILMLSFYPSQSLFPSLFAKSGSKLVVGPTNNSTLT